MSLMTALSRRSEPTDVGLGLAAGVPSAFEALLDALKGARAAGAACDEIGRTLASEGIGLAEALDGLELTFRSVGRAPDFAATRALCDAWAETSLQFVHTVSCEDPLTGLASRAHLRSRLDELYREAAPADTCIGVSHAIAVVEIVARRPHGGSAGPFDSALRVAVAVDDTRQVFSGGETLARLGTARIGALAPRTERLPGQITALRALLVDHDHAGDRVWVEKLPPSVEGACQLLDELSR